MKMRVMLTVVFACSSLLLFSQSFVQIGLPNTIGIVKEYPRNRIFKTGLMAQLGYDFYDGKLSMGVIATLSPDLFSTSYSYLGVGLQAKVVFIQIEKWKINSVTDILTLNSKHVPQRVKVKSESHINAACTGLSVERIFGEKLSVGVSATLGLYKGESGSFYGVRSGWYSSQPISLSMFYHF